MGIYLAVLTAILNQIGFGGSRVAVSLFALELGANQFTIGVMIALYSLCPMLFAITIGRLADRMPPRLPMMAGSAALAAAMLLPVLFPTIYTLYVSAFLLGLCHQIFTIPLEAVVGGIGGEDKRARNYALITMGWSAANFLGPLITGFSIDLIGHVQVFIVLAVFTFLPILILWLAPEFLPRAARHKEKKAGASVLDLWRSPYLRTTYIAGAIIGSAQDLFQFYLPIYGHKIGLSASAIGAILGMVALASFVVRAIIPFFAKRLNEVHILIISIFVSASAFVLLPFFVNAYALAAIAFVLGMGVGCAQPMAMSLLYILTPAGRIAEAIGLYKTVRNGTHLVIPMLFGSVGSAFGFTTVFLSNAVMLVAGGTLLQRTRVPDEALRPRKP